MCLSTYRVKYFRIRKHLYLQSRFYKKRLYLIATLQVQVRSFWMKSQINSFAGVSDDILGSGILRVSSPHQFLHLVNVERGDNVREGQVLSN